MGSTGYIKGWGGEAGGGWGSATRCANALGEGGASQCTERKERGYVGRGGYAGRALEAS